MDLILAKDSLALYSRKFVRNYFDNQSLTSDATLKSKAVRFIELARYSHMNSFSSIQLNYVGADTSSDLKSLDDNRVVDLGQALILNYLLQAHIDAITDKKPNYGAHTQLARRDTHAIYGNFLDEHFHFAIREMCDQLFRVSADQLKRFEVQSDLQRRYLEDLDGFNPFRKLICNFKL